MFNFNLKNFLEIDLFRSRDWKVQLIILLVLIPLKGYDYFCFNVYNSLIKLFYNFKCKSFMITTINNCKLYTLLEKIIE